MTIGSGRASQRAIAAAAVPLYRRGLARRSAPLPVLGAEAASHLTSVLRLNVELPRDVSKVLVAGYRYPTHTIHVTVRNLDRATVPVERAVARLERLLLEPVVLSIEGLGCSPDTLFLRCTHGPELVRLRRAVDAAFGLPTGHGPVGALFSRISFANVVRFDGPGYWPGRSSFKAIVRIPTMEVVRTDKYLSDEGTTTLAVISLANSERVS